MASIAFASNKLSTCVQWMWNASVDPFSESESVKWDLYSDVENMIIEKAFLTDKNRAMLDDYYIDFNLKLQISNSDSENQRPVKRMVCSREDRRLGGERFIPNPVAPDRPFGGQYGFIPPFIKEAAIHLGLKKPQLPSKNKTVVPMIVEMAAQGIIEEGKKVKKQFQAEFMANQLLEKKTAGMKEVWKCCAYLYSLESFLYQRLNEIMRLIGSEQHEKIWRNKISTLGPFCLLLWDNPFDSQIVKPKTILYRGADLPDNLITQFMSDCSKDPRPWHTFQAFTSTSRNRDVTKRFGNVLFIMKTKIAFTVNLTSLSAHPEEEEELLLPGVSFTIDQVKFDGDTKKHLIYLTLQQRHTRNDQHQLNQTSTQPTETIFIYRDDCKCSACNDDRRAEKRARAYATRLDYYAGRGRNDDHYLDDGRDSPLLFLPRPDRYGFDRDWLD